MKFEVCGYEHTHLHTEFSLLDGYQTTEEAAKRAKAINQQFLCISDHGMMAAVPSQIRECEKNNLHPIFACELYVNPAQTELKEDEEFAAVIKDQPIEYKKLARKSYHLLAVAYNNIGYSNLVALSSWGWTKGFYRRPRVNHEQLMRYKEGIIFTSCCYNSEIGQAFDREGEDAGFSMIEKYIEMFGEHFYLEIMLLDFPKQKPYNKFIIRASEKYHIPIILTNDCHYAVKEDSHMQRLMLMIQTGKTLADFKNIGLEEETDFFELQDKNLWMKSEDELNEKWFSDYRDAVDYEIFKQAKRNTVELCRKAKGVILDRTIKLPKFDNEEIRLRELILKGFKQRQLPATSEYLKRIEEEYELICHKGFASYFLIQKMMVDEARRICPELLGWGTGYEAIGPGRGSGVGALTNYVLGVTDVDPIEHDLLFWRFLSPARGGKQMKLRFSS